MIEYIANFYNETNNECQLSTNFKTFDLTKLNEKENEDINLVIIEKQTTTGNSKKSQPVLILLDKNKWQTKYKKYLNQSSIILISKYTTILIIEKCRQLSFSNKEEMMKKLEKIQKNYYFMDNSPMPSFEEYQKRKFPNQM